MSYQVNLNQNTSVYVNRQEDASVFGGKSGKADEAVSREGSVQAVTKEDEGLVQALNGEELGAGTPSAQVLKNTEQYMELLEKNGSASDDSDEIESEEDARERRKEIYKNLTAEEIAKLKMMQVDLSAVSLSDIAGLVASIRSEANRQEFAQKIADICDGIDAVSGKITHDNLKEALQSLLPEEVSDLVVDSVLEEGYQISEPQMIYLLKNELQLTVGNLYKAEYATSSGSQKEQLNVLDEKAMALLMPQMEAIIDQAGLEQMGSTMDKEALTAAARFMIEHEIALTPDNLRNYAAIQAINENGIDALVLAENMLFRAAYKEPAAFANVYFPEQQTAEKLEENIASMTGETIHVAERQGIAFTLHALTALYKEQSAVGAGAGSKDANAAAGLASVSGTADSQNDIRTENLSRSELTARRQLEEIRLSMTQEAAARLVMSDIHIDTKELSEIVKQLRAVEQKMMRETFAAYDMDYTEEAGALYQETMQKAAGLGRMPAAVLAFTLQSDGVTIPALYEEGMRLKLAGIGGGYDAVGAEGGLEGEPEAVSNGIPAASSDTSAAAQSALQRYETVMTMPRADMGDSISKAFARIDSLLAEMNMEPTEANRRAVRILGYNQMELTPENIAEIKNADTKVNRMLTEMTPKAVLDLIRRHKNPLEMTVDELNEALQENKPADGTEEAERFSEFLYKLQRKGDITPAERESFIGIYRLLDKVQKHSGRDIGFVVKAGQELTMKNLLSAHRSNQAKGMEFAASDENGSLTSVTSKGTSISSQIAAAYIEYGQSLMDDVMEELTPEGLSGVLSEMEEAMLEQNPSGTDEVSVGERASGKDRTFVGEKPAPMEVLENSEMSLETFADKLGGYADTSLSAEYARTLYEQSVSTAFTEAAEQLAADAGIAFTQGNLSAIEAMLADDAGIYGMMKTLLAAHPDQGLRGKYDAMFAETAAHFEDAAAVADSYDALSEALAEDIYDMAEQPTGQSADETAAAQSYSSDDDAEPVQAGDGILTYRDIQSLKQIQLGFSVLKSMAEQEQFQIPVQVDGAWKLLNVRFVNSQAPLDSGSISFAMHHDRFGDISAQITTGASVTGAIETERGGTLEWPQEIMEKAGQAVTRKDRYGLAKEIFTVLSSLSGT